MLRAGLLASGLALACSSATAPSGENSAGSDAGAVTSGGGTSAATLGGSTSSSLGGAGASGGSSNMAQAGGFAATAATGGASGAAGAPLAAGGAAGGVSAGGSVAMGGRAPLVSGGAVNESGGATAQAGNAAGGSAGTAGSSGSAGNAGSGGNSPVTVWIAGDSTVANGNTPCPVGWGAQFKSFFRDDVKVVNSAVGGRSVRTWLYNVTTEMDKSSGECVLQTDASGEPTLQARWRDMLSGMKQGDYLFIQFGINDGSATCDRHVGIAAFKESYGMMATAAKARGAQPVFLTPASAVACNGSSARATRGEYVTATLDAGKQFEVPVIDLHASTIALYNSRGFCPIPGGDVSASTTGPVGDFFCDDHTHFSQSGAAAVAELVARAVREQNLGLAAHLK